MYYPTNKNNQLVILVGPSGSGKTTVAEFLIKKHNFTRVITCTTRDRRDYEKDGIDYNFYSHEEFKNRIDKHEFVEHSLIHNNFYGVRKQDMFDISFGIIKNTVLVADYKGVLQIKPILAKYNVKAIVIFIHASLETLGNRLEARGESPQSITKRLNTAKEELEHIDIADYVFNSTHINQDLDIVSNILVADQCKVKI